jgi:hypothetical protein
LLHNLLRADKVKTIRYENSIALIFIQFIQFTQVAIFLIASLLQRILPFPFYFGKALPL